MITSHFNFVDKSPLPHENGYIMRSKCLSKINPFPDEDNLPKIDIICRRTKMSKQQRSKLVFVNFPLFSRFAGALQERLEKTLLESA